jgi:hypothetical protein
MSTEVVVPKVLVSMLLVLVPIAVGSAVALAGENKTLEERVADIEQRLAFLEGRFLPAIKKAEARNSVLQAQTQLSNFEMAVNMYYAENRRLPETLQDLTKKNADGDSWLDSIPRDPWGNDYVFRLVGTRDFQIRSSGPDGQPETADDIVWPKAAKED